jgi:L-fuconolactonase
VATACPTLSLVLEHGGGLGRPDVGDFATALGNLLELGRYPNISIKLPGLGQLAKRKPSVDDGESPLEMTDIGKLVGAMMDAFGPDRIMWGSDFPPVAAREGYANALGWCRDVVSDLRPTAVPAIFGGSAAKVWFS